MKVLSLDFNRDKLKFSSNLLSTFCCSVLVSLAAFSWLRAEISVTSAVSLEIIASAILALDVFLSRRDHGPFFRSRAGVLTIVMGVVPWFALANLVAPGNPHPLYIMLAHSSFAPYLLMRFRFLTKEFIIPNAIKIAFGINLFLLSMHWLATAWILLQPRQNVDFLTEYNMALYYLMTTIATVGYGDIAPTDNASRLFTMALEIMGVCIFGLVISQLSRMILNADRRKEKSQEEMAALVSLVRHYDLPPELQSKSYRFLRHLISSGSNEEEMRILSRLPHSLQGEIRAHMNAKPLSKVSLFRCSCKRHYLFFLSSIG